MRTPFLETCQTRYLLADGGIGTTLRDMKSDPSLLPELLNISDADTVLAMHRQFAESGADCITTNSFSANATRLTDITPEECLKLCSEAARLARQAAGPDRYLLGSVGPWYNTGENWSHALGEQVRALVGGGVDAIVLETVTSLEAATACTDVARQHAGAIPVIVSFTFKRSGPHAFALAQDGAPLEAVAGSLKNINANAFGANCGKDVEAFDFATLVSALRAETDKCLVARPAALSAADSPEMMAEAVWGIVRAGANIIGGCCGTGPEHIRAYRNELDMLG